MLLKNFSTFKYITNLQIFKVLCIIEIFYDKIFYNTKKQKVGFK